MTTRILLIHEGGDQETLEDLRRAARRAGIETKHVRLRELVLHIGSKVEVRTIDGERVDLYDGGVVRGIGALMNIVQFLRRLALLRALEELGVVLMNPVEPMMAARNKLEALVRLRLAGLPTPETFSYESARLTYELCRRWRKVVLKPVAGSRGFGAILAEGPDVAFNVLRELAAYRIPMLVQRYIEGPGWDLRVFVVGGEVIAAMKRVARGDWRCNIAQGGVGEPAKIDDEIAELAVKATEALGLWYAGVDIVLGEEGPYILELNASPDWRELKRVTGVDPSDAIIRYLIEVIRGGREACGGRGSA